MFLLTDMLSTLHVYRRDRFKSAEAGCYKIGGFDLLSYAPHMKHGKATYVWSDIMDEESPDFCDAIQVGGFQVANVYKPPKSTGTNKFHQLCLIQPFMLESLTATFTAMDWGYMDVDANDEQHAN
ncbi:hypothetical protein Y1Q_0016154 [Alligator mississippiensis]|uniref:Uncharacterized protein n=1 Tax=Alligator mississippiensis TaxID=8496 RepID=A0A151P0X3_ALLMI|nr:hypothetical protein Y1Q_0016154 [Alligator mississippiensis]